MTDYDTFVADLRHPDEQLRAPDLDQIMLAGRRLRRRRRLVAGGGATALLAAVLAFPIGVLLDRQHPATGYEQPGSSVGTGVEPTPSPSAYPSDSPSPGWSPSFTTGSSGWPSFTSGTATASDSTTGTGSSPPPR